MNQCGICCVDYLKNPFFHKISMLKIHSRSICLNRNIFYKLYRVKIRSMALTQCSQIWKVHPPDFRYENSIRVSYQFTQNIFPSDKTEAKKKIHICIWRNVQLPHLSSNTLSMFIQADTERVEPGNENVQKLKFSR